VGISFLIAAKIVEMDDFNVLLGQVGLYFITVIIGLFIHGSMVLPAIYFATTRKNPYVFIAGISQAMATAFGTSSR
jgi:Na+/H+-dicarboxylate symporter